jgi:hypothetical protein
MILALAAATVLHFNAPGHTLRHLDPFHEDMDDDVRDGVMAATLGVDEAFCGYPGTLTTTRHVLWALHFQEAWTAEQAEFFAELDRWANDCAN